MAVHSSHSLALLTSVRPSAAASLRRSCVIALGLLSLATMLPACQDPLLTPDEPRSQYDRNDAVRERRAPSYVFDEFGDRKPNIRGRLMNFE